MHAITKRTLLLLTVASLLTIGVSLFRLTTRATASSSPFQGIAAVQDATTGGLDAVALDELKVMQTGAGGSIGGQISSNAHVLSTAVAGHTAYVVPSSTGDFCFFVEQLGEACRTPLTPSDPVLFVVSDPDGPGGVGPTAWGVAVDGVESVTFTEDGGVHTVPVHGNVFEFSGASSADVDGFTNVVANFTDGHGVAAN